MARACVATTGSLKLLRRFAKPTPALVEREHLSYKCFREREWLSREVTAADAGPDLHRSGQQPIFG